MCFTASRRQSSATYQPEMTVQGTVSYREVSETVAALASQVEQLTTLVQDTILQRLTAVETELMGEPSA